VREFTACNPFVNHGPYISVADTERRILYVTMVPEMAAGWAYKLVPFDAILKYIVKRLTLEELDVLAEGEQKVRDELADVLEELCANQAEVRRLKLENKELRVQSSRSEFKVVGLKLENAALERATHQLVMGVKAAWIWLLPAPLARLASNIREYEFVRRVAYEAPARGTPHDTAEMLVRLAQEAQATPSTK